MVLQQTIMMLLVFIVSIQAGVAVKIFSKDEVLLDANMSKPRIYIQNTGTVALSGIKFYYYFTTENGKTPVLENYYVPGFTVALQTVSTGNYKIEYTLNSTLNVGAIIPDNNGCVVGLHYNTWDAWDKTNDYSNNRLAAFAENPLIVVYQNGTRIYGTEPGWSGGTPTPAPDIPDGDIRLNSFALYSTQQTIVKERSVFNGGGAVGSNTFVDVKNDAVIHGNVVSGANATLWHRVVIDGNIILGGTLAQSGMGNTFTSLQEGATVATLTLQDFPVTTNTDHITVNQNATRDLAPGIYGDLNVLQKGVLRLSPGNYTFAKFYIENGAKVIFQISNYQQKIEIASSGEFNLQDSSELKFATLAYAPSVQIYSRDQNELRIGVKVKTVGIITAPFATVNVYSGSRCDGAIYAKIINVEPDAIINSEMVTDDDDYDNDGVPTRLEIKNCVRQTDPKDENEYEPQAIPDKLVIDNTQKVIITYDLNRFYNAYSPDAKLILICPPGALQDPTKPPVVQFSEEKPAGLPALPGYVPVGMYFQIKCNQRNNGKPIFAGIPMPGNSTTGNFNMAMHVPGASSWTTFQYPYTFLSVLSDEDRNLLMDSTEVIAMVPYSNTGTDDVGTLVATWKNTGTAVAYFDDGTVFSSKIGSEIEVNMTLTDVTGMDPANPGKIFVDYTDLANPATDILPLALDFTISGDVMTCVGAISTTSNGIRLNSVIVKTRSAGGSEVTVLSKSPALEAAQSESFYIHSYCNLADINKDKKFSIYKVATMAFESAQLAGDGLITKDGSDFNYSYFLKDHLGSTRMVLAQNGEIKQALMYQPYGTIAPVDGILGTGNDPLRHKFTTKEFDEDGEVNGAPGIKAFYFGARMYDPGLGMWQSRDPKGQFFNPYAYAVNPVIFIDPDGTTFGAFMAAVAIGAATSAGGYAIGQNITGDKINANGLISSAIAGAVGGVVSYAGGAISDALVGTNHLGPLASYLTETGVNMALATIGNAAMQGIFIGRGLQDRFSFGSLVGSAAGSFLLTSLRVASRGYLQNSTDYTINSMASQYEDECERYKYASGHDPMVERVRNFRTGGGIFTKDLGNHFPGGGISVYGKQDAHTLIHELGHLKMGTTDRGSVGNAYGFETWVFDNPNYSIESPAFRSLDIPAYTWTQGRPDANVEYTDWGLYKNGSRW